MRYITKKSLVHIALTSTLFIVVPPVLSATIISTPVIIPPPYQTNVGGDLTITSTGSLSGTGTAIEVENVASIIIDPNNINPAAINTTGTAILIDGAGVNATITIGENSTVQGDRGIDNAQGTFTLTNSGTMTAINEVVRVNVDAIFADIINTSTGLMEATGTGDVLEVGFGDSISNSGIMSSTTGNIIRLLSGSIITNAITNTGTMQTTNAQAIVVETGTSIGGGIINSGIITAGGGNNAINLGATTNGILFTNNAPGVVTGNVIVTSNSSAGSVLEMNGGTINGTVIGLVAGAARTFTVNGGTITGGIDLSASTQADNILQFGGSIGDILGNTGTGQSLNILGPVTTGGGHYEY